VISAYRRGSVLDRVMSVLALGGVAMPSFWLGILLIIIFAVQLSLLPPSGFVSITKNPADFVRYMILPAITLGAVQAAVVMRQVRSSLLEVLNEDYVRTARAKGLGERRVVLQHGLRNALLPVVTVIGLQVSRLLGGSVVVETVFAMPGLGRYGVDAIFIRDYPVVQVVVLVTALIVVFSNLITDLLYAVLDPRIKLS
jgi:peptide/nickel transport system permease protein